MPKKKHHLHVFLFLFQGSLQQSYVSQSGETKFSLNWQVKTIFSLFFYFTKARQRKRNAILWMERKKSQQKGTKCLRVLCEQGFDETYFDCYLMEAHLPSSFGSLEEVEGKVNLTAVCYKRQTPVQWISQWTMRDEFFNPRGQIV